MDVSDIEKIIAILKANEVFEFELEQEGTRIKLSRQPRETTIVRPAMAGEYLDVTVASTALPVPGSLHGAAAGLAGKDSTSRLTPVESPVVGTFYRRPAPDADAFVEEGQVVKKGDTLCIVEAMKVMNEIEAPCNGRVQRALLKDGDIVEFGETLFLIDPSN